MYAQHTPGPWQYGHVGSDALWIGPSYDQTPVAHIDHDTEFSRENSRANACLIAAAPEMAEALKAILGEDTVTVHVGFEDDVTSSAYVYAEAVRTDSEAFEKGRAALAKASPTTPPTRA